MGRIKIVFLGICLLSTALLAGCGGGLSHIPTPPIEFDDVLPANSVDDRERQVIVVDQVLQFEVVPTSGISEKSAVGTANAIDASGNNLVFARSIPIEQVPTAAIGYLSATASINVAFGSYTASDIRSYSINIRFESGDTLKTADSNSTVPVYVSVDGGTYFHRVTGTRDQLVSTSSATLSNGQSTVPFLFRFDMSQVESSTFSGKVVIELIVELARNQTLNSSLQASLLGKGINIGNDLEEIPEGNNETGLVVTQTDFRVIKAAGFDTVRLPINWGGRVGSAPGYEIPTEFFSRVDSVINQAMSEGLNVIIDYHSQSTTLSVSPSTEAARLTAVWQQIASRYQNKSSRLYYEIFNEPDDQISTANWNQIQNSVIQSIRSIDSFHTIIVTGKSWSAPESLSGISLNSNQNLIAMVHFYDPILFTHQGAEWMGSDFSVTGVTWPGPPSATVNPPRTNTAWIIDWFHRYNTVTGNNNPASQGQIERQFDIISTWKTSNIPVVIGEFGTYKRGPMDSRANWTRAVRKEAEERGIPWCFWEYSSGFGAYDRSNATWRSALLSALMD